MTQMLSGLANNPPHAVPSALDWKKFTRRGWLAWFLAIVALTAVIGYFLYQGDFSGKVIAWLLYAAGIAVIIHQPRYGIYLMVFLALIGDRMLTVWYPFVTNFSSRENLMFLNDSLIFNPFETYLVLTYLVWLVRAAVLRKLNFFRGDLFWPSIVFLGFILFGFVYGVAGNGNVNVALWEIRPIVYMPAMLILTQNLIVKRHQVNVLMWLVMIAICLKGISGVLYVATELNWNIYLVPSITEHSAAIHFNSFFIFTLAAWIFRDSFVKRILLPLMALPVAISFMSTQRRASYLVLIIALILMAIVLFREKRKLFWGVVPAAVILFCIYAAVFWNNEGASGMPIRALKSQIAPEQISSRDKASDVYRVMENYNIIATIRRVPVIGTGFGQMFDMVVLLPDISFFVWWRYVTHNSILWIWMNTGIGGFLSMLFLIGASIGKGLQTEKRMPDGYLKTAAFSATFYIIMHFMFSYADIAWDSQNMIYIGAMMGLISCLDRVALLPKDLPARRWPWQPAPVPSLPPDPVEQSMPRLP